MKAAAIAALTGALIVSQPAIAAPPGACRTVQGRMDLWNGAPTVRIWVLGTRRMLGVGNMPDALPAPVQKIWDRSDDPDWRFSISIYGDYRVCNVTRQRPGRMQKVQVVGARNLAMRPRPRERLR